MTLWIIRLGMMEGDLDMGFRKHYDDINLISAVITGISSEHEDGKRAKC